MSSDHSGGHPDMDYHEHNRTYAGFLTATKITIVSIAILLVGMFIFLV